MRSFWALVKKDLKGYFDQPTGYILLVIFTGVTSFLYFRTALSVGEASLRPLFDSLPWILAVFVPAATMRLVAEEQRDGTLEILLTQPLRTWTVLFSKYLAGFAFVSVGIVFTIGIALALMTAGDLDEGAVVAQYFGTFFLVGAYVAIGLFSSSITRNQIVAFMAALTLTLGLTLAGMPIITLALPSGIAVLLQDLSPLTHFSSITRGVLDLRDVIYFIAIISTFSSATYLMIRGKSVSHRSRLYRNLQLGVAGLLIISVLAGWFGRDIDGRWDLTERKLYTLSKATAGLLADLDDIVTVKLFASKDPPVQVALAERDVNDFLDDIAAESDGKLRIVRRFPDVDEAAEKEAEENFIPAIQFNVETQRGLEIKLGYLGISMRYANQHEPIQFVEDVGGLEYRVASNIFRMTQKEPKTIMFLYGHGEMRRDAMLQSLRDQLERHYFVHEITEDEDGFVGLDLADVLVVPGPSRFIDSQVMEGITDYLAAGGKALFLIDPVQINQQLLRAQPNDFSLAQYLQEYGVYAGNDLVYDMRSNETLVFGSQNNPVYLPYPYWVRVPTVEFKISGGVDSAVFPWSSSIILGEPTTKGVEVEFTKLLETSETGGVDLAYDDIGPQSPLFASITEEDLRPQTLAVALTGTRCPALRPLCTDKNTDNPFRIIVATDSDWISETIVRQNPAHLDMATNWIDWLMQEDALVSIRAKGAGRRQLIFESPTHRTLVQYGNILGLPAIFVVLGLARYFARRRQTRKVYTSGG